MWGGVWKWKKMLKQVSEAQKHTSQTLNPNDTVDGTKVNKKML